MPRINLSVSQDLYDKLLQEADALNITVNQLILRDLQSKYGNESNVDYIVLLDNMVRESGKMKGDFILADLPTYAGVGEILYEINSKVSEASVKARLGKMYNELVRKGYIKGVDRATIEKNGKNELKFSSRAAVYTKSKKQKDSDL